MAAKRHERSQARANALALLYSSDITEHDARGIVDEGLYPDKDFNFSEYSEKLVRGVADHQEQIDQYLEETSENWTLLRMPVVDRAILRLATYEMLYIDSVPISVSINEAVDLAKAYGGDDDSARFVNGVLGRIALKIEEASKKIDDEIPPSETVDEA